MDTTTKTKVYRASSAPLYATCPAAPHDENDAVLVDPVDEAGTLGQAVHAACADIVIEAGCCVDLGSIGQGYALDAGQMKELEILTAIARRFWQEYGPQFGQCRVEAEMRHRNEDGTETSGHQDVIGFSEDVCRVLDWKTTRLEAVNYKPQMMEYLWLARHAAAPASPGKEAEFFQYVICFLRDKTVEVSQIFSSEYIDEWHEEYMKSIREWDGKTYRPGGHCCYCPRSAVCPGLCHQLSNTAHAIMDYDHAQDLTSPLYTSVACVALYERIKLLDGFMNKLLDSIKIRARQEGGTLQGDGKALILKEQTEKEIIPLPAWPILTARVKPEAIAPCMTIRKYNGDGGPGILDIITADAPKRGKKKAREMLMDELEAGGAIQTKTKIVPRIVAALPAATEKEIEGTDNGNGD